METGESVFSAPLSCHTGGVQWPTETQPTDPAPLPTARLRASGFRGHAREFEAGARDWMRRRATATSQVAARSAPIVLAVLFISAISVGLGIILSNTSGAQTDLRWNESSWELMHYDIDLQDIQWDFDTADWNATPYDQRYGPLEIDIDSELRQQRLPELYRQLGILERVRRDQSHGAKADSADSPRPSDAKSP